MDTDRVQWLFTLQDMQWPSASHSSNQQRLRWAPTFSFPWFSWREIPALWRHISTRARRRAGAVRRRASAGRSASCRTMKRSGPLPAASGGDAAAHVPAVVLQLPHPITPGGVTTSVPTPSKACTSKKADATHLPYGPVQPPMA
jgi:hypothetical protein